MKILLDTHMVIWSLTAPERLPLSVKKAIDKEWDIYFSYVTLIEIALKISASKFPYKMTAVSAEAAIRQAGFMFQNFTIQQMGYFQTLPFHHRDPFDRLLIAQAQCHDMVLASADEVFTLYDVPLL